MLTMAATLEDQRQLEATQTMGLKLVVHDYAGHPFQASLSRALAARGHVVSHIYFADNPGPKGVLQTQPPDPPSLHFAAITLGRASGHAAGTGARIGPTRVLDDLAYGRKAAQLVQSLQPDVVLSGNTPPDAQRAMLKVCKAGGVGFVYWLQDIYSMAVSTLLSRRIGYAGAAVGRFYQWLERQQFRASDAIIAISEDFLPLVTPWADNENKVSVIENWAATDDISVGVRDNDWSHEQGLGDGFRFVYSGTLGQKHNPMLLAALAKRCEPENRSLLWARVLACHICMLRSPLTNWML